MSQSVLQFWQLIAQSGLLSKSDCNQQAVAFADAHAGKQPETAAELCAFLLKRKAITPYQAQVLSAGAAGPFDYGDYRVTDRVTAGPLKGVFRAVHQPSGHKVGLWFLPANADADGIAAAKQSADFHAGIRSPFLSESYGLVDLGSMRFVVLEDLTSEPLAATIKGKLPVGHACRLTRELAEAILPLHERGGPHGHVSASNILVDKQGTVKLLSYPLCDVPDGPKEGGPSPLEDTRALGRLLLTLIDGSSSKTRDELAARLTAISGAKSDVPPGVAKCVARTLGADEKKLRHAAEVVVALAPFADMSKEQVAPPSKAMFEAALRGESIPQPAKSQTPSSTSPTIKVAQNAAQPAASATTQAATSQRPAAAAIMPKIKVDAEATSPIIRGRRSSSGRSSSGRGRMIAIGVCVVVVLGGAVGLWASGVFDGAEDSATNPDQPDGTLATKTGNTLPGEGEDHAAADGDANGNSSPRNTEQAVAYTRRDFWVSPTDGDAVDFRYLPSGAQAYLAWRPAQWLTYPRGAALLAEIPPIAAAAEGLLKQHAGLPPEEIESITVAFLPGAAPDMPRTTAIVRTVSPISADVLKKSFADLDSDQLDGKEVLLSGDMGFYLPADDDHLLVSAPLTPLANVDEKDSLLRLALAAADEPAPANREVTILQRASDADRLLTVIFVPNFPFTQFKAMWSGAAADFAKPFREFFSTDTRACSLSVDLQEDRLFLELRAVGVADVPTIALTNMYQDRVTAFPREWENAMVNVNVSEYSRKILYRFPRMLEMLAEHVEGASYRDHATLRCYLPDLAAENLLFAAKLAMIETSATGPVIPTTSGNQPEIFANVTDLLAKKKISLEISRDTLEETLNKFASTAGVTVKIDGGALQLDGIAKNKSLGTDEKDKPAGAVLRAILGTADSRLVYILKTEDDEEVLLVTTRSAAEQRGETIPPEFSTTSGGQE